jgi:hypothetical protein
LRKTGYYIKRFLAGIEVIKSTKINQKESVRLIDQDRKTIEGLYLCMEDGDIGQGKMNRKHK